MNYRVVIPARLGSERLPGKPLADIHGKPMIVRVVDAVARSSAEEILVATDDQAIVDAVQHAGGRAVMTRSDHPSGSDRVTEVAAIEGWPEDQIVLNVQGDEPLIPPEVLDQLAAALSESAELASATLCEPIATFAELTDPNVVKVVRDVASRALYFSRAPIPYDRNQFNGKPDLLPDNGRWWRHVGVYGYRVWALQRFVKLPVGELEGLERLEQLRLLENGLPMQVLQACQPVPAGVDTEQDLTRVRRLFRGPRDHAH